MRIAFAIFKYFPYGGIQRDLMKVAREARRRGHEVKIFTLRWQAPPLDETLGIEVEILPISGLSRHTQYDKFAHALNTAVQREPFDLVVGFNKMAGLDAYYAGDSCYLEKALHQRSSAYRLLPRFKSFYAAEQAVFDEHSPTQILAISDHEIPRYRHHYRTPPERFHMLPPGIERDRVAPPDADKIGAELRAELGLADDALMLLFIGSGFKKKGLDRALLAVAALPRKLRNRVQFFVVGRDRADSFERMAMRLGIEDQTTFFADGREDVPRFLFAADALLLPAYDENAGMVIIESLLAGLPALVTRNCGYAKYLKKYEAGIVLDQPFSQLAMNTALVELLTSDQRASWSANGLRAAADDQLFQLVPTVVDKLEQFAHERRPVLIFCLFRYFAYGGLQRDFMRIALACQADGYAIVVYCLEWFGQVPDGFHVERIEVAGVVNHVRYQNFGQAVTQRAHWRRPAAVIGFNKIPGLDIYYAADPCFEHKAQTQRKPIYRYTRRYKQMAAYERAVFEPDAKTHILLITQQQQEDFVTHYHTQPERFHVLPPGVSQDRQRQPNWREARQAVRDELDLKDHELLLLLVGSGFITKGLDRLLLAVAALPGEMRARVRLLVIGQDNPTVFLRQAQKLNIAERVTIQSGRNDIPDVLQGADLMVHPAYSESGGLVLIEAIIAGLPVIATGACGFAHYIEEAGAGRVLAEPFSQAHLNQAVVRALDDEAQRQTWSAAGVAFGQTHQELYDMPRHALSIINQLVNSR